jgi:hypothetical protein
VANTPARTNTSREIASFLQKKKAIDTVVSRSPRLLFAIDATASRQPTWDLACSLQADMFAAAAKLKALSVQLCYYRGLHDFHASRWLGNPAALAGQMSEVQCLAGQTQIARVLRHALAEHGKTPVRALVFIGDAMEESAQQLKELAGKLGLLKLPLFIFQEGADPQVADCFRDLARLSGGAHSTFNQASASTLADLLGAVARFASGGRAALEQHGGRADRLLLEQLR